MPSVWTNPWSRFARRRSSLPTQQFAADSLLVWVDRQNAMAAPCRAATTHRSKNAELGVKTPHSCRSAIQPFNT